MVTTNLLQNLRDTSGHVRSPTESEEWCWKRPISYRLLGIVLVTSYLLQNMRDSGGQVISPSESEG